MKHLNVGIPKFIRLVRSLTYLNASVKKFRSQYLFPLVQSHAIANDMDVLAKKDAFVEAMNSSNHRHG